MDEIEVKRQQEIIRIVEQQYELVKNLERQKYHKYSDEQKYVILNLVNKIDAHFIYEILIKNELIPKTQTENSITLWIHLNKSTSLPIIQNSSTLQTLNNIINNSIKIYSQESSISKYRAEVRYIALNLVGKVLNKNIFEAINNFEDLPGDKFKTLNSLHKWLSRNKTQPIPTIYDSTMKQKLDTMIENVINQFNLSKKK